MGQRKHFHTGEIDKALQSCVLNEQCIALSFFPQREIGGNLLILGFDIVYDLC